MSGKAVLGLLKVTKAVKGVSGAGKLVNALDERTLSHLSKLSDEKINILLKNITDKDNLITVLNNNKSLSNLIEIKDYDLVKLLDTGTSDFGVKLINYGTNESDIALKLLSREESMNNMVLENIGNGEFVVGKFKKEYLEQLVGFHTSMDDVLNYFDISMNDFQKLKMKRITDLTLDEQALLVRIRDLVPKATHRTLMQKVIPLNDIEKYMNGQAIRGFVAKAGDGVPYVSYDDVIESFRLDYSWIDSKTNKVVAPFIDNSEGYGLIRFKSTNITDVEIPYGKSMGGVAVDGAPCTLNGFAGGRNGSIMPELKVTNSDGLDLVHGAEFYRVDASGKEILIGIYNEDKAMFIPIGGRN